MTQPSLSPLQKALRNIAIAVFQFGQRVGNVEQLRTQQKQSLVAAINELHDRPIAEQGISETDVTTLINARLNQLTNGASAAFDTLKEIEDHLTQGDTATQSILAEIGSAKQKIQQCEQEIATLKQFIGISSSDEFERLINQALTQGV